MRPLVTINLTKIISVVWGVVFALVYGLLVLGACAAANHLLGNDRYGEHVAAFGYLVAIGAALRYKMSQPPDPFLKEWFEELLFSRAVYNLTLVGFLVGYNDYEIYWVGIVAIDTLCYFCKLINNAHALVAQQQKHFKE